MKLNFNSLARDVLLGIEFKMLFDDAKKFKTMPWNQSSPRQLESLVNRLFILLRKADRQMQQPPWLVFD